MRSTPVLSYCVSPKPKFPVDGESLRAWRRSTHRTSLPGCSQPSALPHHPRSRRSAPELGRTPAARQAEGESEAARWLPRWRGPQQHPQWLQKNLKVNSELSYLQLCSHGLKTLGCHSFLKTYNDKLFCERKCCLFYN